MSRTQTTSLPALTTVRNSSCYWYVIESTSVTRGETDWAHVLNTASCCHLQESMDVMGFTKQEQHNLFRVIAAILHLGNILVTQDRSDQAQLKDTSVAEKVCHVLGIPLSEFVKGLLKPKVKAGREWVVQARTDQQVLYSIEALSKALYERMFDWIISRINDAIDTPGKKFTTFIGVLDIAGFEIFEVSSVVLH